MSDLMSMMDDVKFLELLSRLYFEKGDFQKAVTTLEKCKEHQIRILKRNPSEVPDMPEQKKLAAKSVF